METEALEREYYRRNIARLKSDAERNKDPEQEKIELLTMQEILDQPDPEWLIEGWLQEDSFALLAGPPDSYKSFLATAWACCVASDLDWLWQPTKHGPAVYVYAEGGTGMGNRLPACLAKNKPAPHAHFDGM